MKKEITIDKLKEKGFEFVLGEGNNPDLFKKGNFSIIYSGNPKSFIPRFTYSGFEIKTEEQLKSLYFGLTRNLL